MGYRGAGRLNLQSPSLRREGPSKMNVASFKKICSHREERLGAWKSGFFGIDRAIDFRSSEAEPIVQKGLAQAVTILLHFWREEGAILGLKNALE